MTHQPFLRLSLSDVELEAHIADCGKHFLKAHAEGDKVLAREWLDKQAEAIKSRSPETVARMEACYFSAEGGRPQRRAQARAAS